MQREARKDHVVLGWRGGSLHAICSCRGPEFVSQNPRGYTSTIHNYTFRALASLSGTKLHMQKYSQMVLTDKVNKTIFKKIFTSGIFQSHISTFWEVASHWAWNTLTSYKDWPESSRNPPVSDPIVVGLHACAAAPGVLGGYWESELRSLCLPTLSLQPLFCITRGVGEVCPI